MTSIPAAANPYQDLYIYYLSGRFRFGRGFTPDGYIGSWEEEDFSFLFFTRPNLELVEATIGHRSDLNLLDHYHMTYDQWQGDEALPRRIGRFLISPPWCAIDRNEADLPIILDPGVVFGTGTHPTTRDCLEALQLAFEDSSIRTALDLGTGSGLLALAAAHLGCRKVLATDLNLLAARTAQRNVRLNGLTHRIVVAQGDAEKFMDYTSDLVVSNIHYDVMKNLIHTRGFLEKRRFILSGLMRLEAARIESTLANLPVKILQRWDQDGIWHTFYGCPS